MRIVRDFPEMTVGIGEIAAIAAPEHVLRRLRHDGAGLDGPSLMTASTSDFAWQFQASVTAAKVPAMPSNATFGILGELVRGPQQQWRRRLPEKSDAVERLPLSAEIQALVKAMLR